MGYVTAQTLAKRKFHPKLPGYGNGSGYRYGSAIFLKSQDPDTARIREVQKYIIIFKNFKKTYLKFRIKTIHESTLELKSLDTL
jgi:hypothetical protein